MTCRGRRCEVLSESRMWESHKSWFDERRLETELWRGLRHRSRPDNRYSPLPSATAPVVDSTKGRLDHGLLRPSIRVRSTSTCGHAGGLVLHGSWVPRDEIASAIARFAGYLADSVATKESIYNGEGSATLYHQPSLLRSLSMSTILRPLAEIASLNLEIMRNAVSEATRMPGRALRRRRSVHVSHSCFAGLQRRLPSGSQLPGEMQVLPFCSSHWSHK